jgi:hypothetical protein
MITDDAMGFAFATFDVYNDTACKAEITDFVGQEISS